MGSKNKAELFRRGNVRLKAFRTSDVKPRRVSEILELEREAIARKRAAS